MKKVSAIVLAAGLSSRMGKFKLELPFRNSTILGEVLHTLAKLSLYEIIVVSGFQGEKLEPILNSYSNIKRVHNPDHETGMTSSIKKGLETLKPGSDGFFICLADLPLIQLETYQRLLDIFNSKKTGTSIILGPRYQGEAGHPVLFSFNFYNDMMGLETPEGAKGLINANSSVLMLIPVGDPGILQDIDTPEVYRWLRGF